MLKGGRERTKEKRVWVWKTKQSPEKKLGEKWKKKEEKEKKNLC